ncbi:DUF2971 domain-containing protein [Pectobacterium parmentieri]|uniref:DUF2971 domain-containing protein n=1 Tax=Pectobacterium parmentieri TaxID=1905730 RepID=UPI001603D87F|nr:DUF2971 domain-containing protein [Pectobacterium parmentieri]
MPVFKYYRPGVYLDKAVRYNELYFSENHELNDPNDLVSFYEFEDDEYLWVQLFELPKISENWDITKLFELNPKFISDINNFFKGRRFFSDFFSLQEFFKDINDDFDCFLTPYLIEGEDNNKDKMKILSYKLSSFKSGFKELLARGVNNKFFSVSFSMDALNPMMWAHYAEGFKGCVLIYKAEGNIIHISDNLYSNDYISVEVLDVNYNNADKFLPLLKCACADDKNFIKENSLVKNKFWEYEKEKRALMIAEFKTIFISHCPKDKYNPYPRDMIYHHEPQELIGVIFGPKTALDKKNKIEYSIRHNKYYSKTGDFFVLETELTYSGDIIIKTGKKCVVVNPLNNTIGTMSEIFEGERLEKLKNYLGITAFEN